MSPGDRRHSALKHSDCLISMTYLELLNNDDDAKLYWHISIGANKLFCKRGRCLCNNKELFCEHEHYH
jgi:hypothetical protein